MKFAVLGAGNGGQAFAAHLALLGEDVTLFDVDAERVDALNRRGSIALEGALEGRGRPRLITGDMADAVRGARALMIVVPACYHESLLERLRPHIEPGQLIVLNPGATGGALLARRLLGKEVLVAETSTLLYACRAKDIGRVRVFAIKDEVEVGVLPRSETTRALELLGAFPQFKAAPGVLHTSFSNWNAMAHPAPTLLNLGRIETGQKFPYYREGMTPSIVNVVEALDRERLAVAAAYGLRPPSLLEALRLFYGIEAASLYDAFRQSRAHDSVMAPESTDTRYLFEDIPTGLVPLVELGGAAEVEAPAMRAVADLGCAVTRRDFWSEGRTLERLGLTGKSVREIRALV